MIVAGVGAAVITLGPVLQWYDRDFLGMDLDELHALDHDLVHFLHHDRITMAGTMIAIGVSFCSRCSCSPPGAPRTGRSGRSGRRGRTRAAQGAGRSAADGVHRVGLFAGGAVVSVVGLTGVFVPSDVVFLGIDPDALRAANPRLLPFIAHDRAGFGGALISAAVAITLLSAWGWRRGESWVWWSLALAAAAGFLPAVLVHGVIHYTDFWHLAPVFLGIGLTLVALVLARPYLCAVRCQRTAAPIEGNASC
jgi:hypothetical protein